LQEEEEEEEEEAAGTIQFLHHIYPLIYTNVKYPTGNRSTKFMKLQISLSLSLSLSLSPSHTTHSKS